MRNFVMPDSSTYALVWMARSLFALLLYSVPAEFWAAIVALLDVPEPVKVFVNPLLGSLCITILEMLNDYRKHLKDPGYVVPDEPGWVFPAKIFVGWVAGGLSMPIFAMFIKASEPTIAFFAGAAGSSFLSIYVSNLIKKIDDSTKDDDNKPNP